MRIPAAGLDRRDRRIAFGYFWTVNFAVVLTLVEPEVPVNVRVYAPGAVLAGNSMPEMANAVLLGCTVSVCGNEPQTDADGPPEQVILTFPEKPFTDCASSRKAASIPRRMVSELGVATSLRVEVTTDVTLKLTLTGVAAA